jgi:16S rRNA (guanine(966)-N(2))-methyltransferase RsmD
MRESLFSILQTELMGVEFWDLYAGSGAVGLEALSRGARLVTFVEVDKEAQNCLRANIAALGVAGRTRVITGKVGAALRHPMAGIVFADPPYPAVSEYETLLAGLDQSEVGPVLVQHDKRLALPERSARLARVRELRQGDNVVSFYRPGAGE